MGMSRTCDAQCHKQLPFRMVVVHPGMVMLGMVFKKKTVFALSHSSDRHHQTVRISSPQGWNLTEQPEP